MKNTTSTKRVKLVSSLSAYASVRLKWPCESLYISIKKDFVSNYKYMNLDDACHAFIAMNTMDYQSSQFYMRMMFIINRQMNTNNFAYAHPMMCCFSREYANPRSTTFTNLFLSKMEAYYKTHEIDVIQLRNLINGLLRMNGLFVEVLLLLVRVKN